MYPVAGIFEDECGIGIFLHEFMHFCNQRVALGKGGCLNEGKRQY
jgi:hypothetical protein